MKPQGLLNLLFHSYSLAWRLGLPILKTSPRIKQGLEKRLTPETLPRADIWIQAASAGESYLAVEILNQLVPQGSSRVLLTSFTSQGLDILNTAIASRRHHPRIQVQASWFPFDSPPLMERAVDQVRPRLVILLETELWPGLLWTLKRRRIPTAIVNGRLSTGSFSRYMATTAIWKNLTPDHILAITPEDAGRFRRLFPDSAVQVMPNIKFDTVLTLSGHPHESRSPLASLFDPAVPLSILASIRTEEEDEMEQLIQHLAQCVPNQVIALFPRHMHRIDVWKHRLNRMGRPFRLRSETGSPVTPGSLILWDLFGELRQACFHADAVFVGGSLKPLGGQNFIEPASCGAATVTGSFLDHFAWVGDDFFTQGLASRVLSWQEAGSIMTRALTHPYDNQGLARKTLEYIRKNQGGTRMACDLITKLLERP